MLKIDPWALRETELRIGALAQTESLFALSNGHIGMRGNLDEGEPTGSSGNLPQRRPRDPPVAVRRDRLRQPGGRRDRRLRSQRQADPPARRRRTDGRALRRAARATNASLDFREGVLSATCALALADGSGSDRSTPQRLVSFTQRGVAAILYEVDAGRQRDAARDPVRARRQRRRLHAAPRPERPAHGRRARQTARSARSTSCTTRWRC